MKVVIDIPEIPKNNAQRWALMNGTPYAHGEWIEKHHERFKYYCSRCGSGADRKGRFCDTCGADMREGEAREE